MPPISARDRIVSLFDTFEEFGADIRGRDPIEFPGYQDEKAAASLSSGEQEAVITGVGTIDGQTMVAAVFEFGFLGGSMGEAVGERLDAAMKKAAESGRPFLAITSTGGARMQEGMAALAQMPRTVAASIDLGSRGVPRISVLAHPTTGGVYASFASLADIVIAERGATVGFAGPRLAKGIPGRPLPEGSHTAEAAFEAGLVDALVDPSALRDLLSKLLRILEGRSVDTPKGFDRRAELAVDRPNRVTAWDEYQIARHPERPSPRFYVEEICDEVFELHGDRTGSDDPAVFGCLALFGHRRMVVAALDRRSPTAGGFRKATRIIELAGRLALPVVTFIDTPGADPTFESEYSGLAAAIARTFEALLATRSPVISIVTGEGGSGGALALACGDIVAIQEHAVFSVIGPEGAAEILHRDPSRAAEVAEQLRPGAHDLEKLGLADVLLPEPKGGAHTDRAGAAKTLGSWLASALAVVTASPAKRADRFRVRPT